jgi:hypothetical protein
VKSAEDSLFGNRLLSFAMTSERSWRNFIFLCWKSMLIIGHISFCWASTRLRPIKNWLWDPGMQKPTELMPNKCCFNSQMKLWANILDILDRCQWKGWLWDSFLQKWHKYIMTNCKPFYKTIQKCIFTLILVIWQLAKGATTYFHMEVLVQ